VLRGGRQARGTAELYHPGLRTGARRTWRDIFPVNIAVLSYGADRGPVDAASANGVHWGTQWTLATTMSHFLELETELELLGPGHNADLGEYQVDSLWTQAC
jgi:hypothetical protein